MSFLFRNKEKHSAAIDRKYIIQYGLVSSTAHVATNIETMEQNAFDGMVIKAQYADPFYGTVNYHNYVCAPYSIPFSALATPLSAMQGCVFKKFRHNFFRMNPAEPGTIWAFDRAGVDAWLNNLYHGSLFAYLSRAFVGVMMDCEAYSSSPFFNYSLQPQTKTFVQYQAQYKALGREAGRRMISAFPACEFVLAISYEQLDGVAVAALPTDTYGLLPSFLDGFTDAIEPPASIHNYQEQGYANQLQSWFDYDFAIQEEKNVPHLGSGNYPYVTNKGMATWPDYPGDGSFDFVDDTQNYDSAAQFALNLGKALAGVDKYVWVYNQEMKWPGFADTSPSVDDVPAVYVSALASARETASIEDAWTPALIPDIKGWLNVDTLSALADTDPITTWTDSSPAGNNATQAGALRPTYEDDAFGAGIPGVDYDLAATQYFLWNGIAASMTGTSMPYSAFFVGDMVTGAPVASQTFIGIGKAGTANPDLSIGQSSASKKWIATRVGDSGTSAQVSSDTLADAGSVITTPFVYSVRSNGTSVELRVNGAIMVVSAASPTAQSVGATTMDQATVGARCKNTISSYIDGKGGDVIFVSRFMGGDEMEKVERYLATKFGVTLA